MKECFNAKERHMSDWTALLQNADEQFLVAGIKKPDGSQLLIIDVK
jgi:hypothetical protein